MRFYLDENIAVGIAIALRSARHFVITAREIGALREHDDLHLFNATQQGCVLVSHDGDFYVLHRGLRRWAAWWQREPFHGGVLVTPDNLGVAGEARILDIFAASGLPTPNQLYGGSPTATGYVAPDSRCTMLSCDVTRPMYTCGRAGVARGASSRFAAGGNPRKPYVHAAPCAHRTGGW